MVDYNQRYQQGYMTDFQGLYEACRVTAVRQTLQSKHLFPVEPMRVVDIACGQGFFLESMEKCYPGIKLYGIDFSPG